MSVATTSIPAVPSPVMVEAVAPAAPGRWRVALRSGRVVVGGGIVLAILLACIVTLPWTAREMTQELTTAGPQSALVLWDVESSLYFARQWPESVRYPPSADKLRSWFGYDTLGRSILGRCLLGGTISLGVGFAAATISVVLGVTVGLIAGYRGGWVDSFLMRAVDVLYGLPYILLVILFKVAFEAPLVEGVTARTVWGLALVLVGLVVFGLALAQGRGFAKWAIAGLALLLTLDGFLSLALWRTVLPPSRTIIKMQSQTANLVVLFSAIGLVSWLTMARVVRGQVLSIRSQPYIEACRAMGIPATRVFMKHILPNLIGPVIVYATLTVPQAILQESFLSFLGVGVNPPLPTWGSLASDGVAALSPVKVYWWMLLFPCLLLVITLLSLNFLGDGLRDVFDPKSEQGKL